MPSLIQKVEAFLQGHPEQRFTAKNIAKYIVESSQEEYKKKAEQYKQTSDVVQQVAAEIGSSRKRLHELIRSTESRPREYYWSDKSDEVLVDEAEVNGPILSPNESKGTGSKESELYTPVCEYLADEHSLYSKRIDEKKSSKKKGEGGNHWLHPDVVAMEDLTHRWDKRVKDCVDACKGKTVRLWSFEVKVAISRSNIRDCYFQTVANSAWANFA